MRRERKGTISQRDFIRLVRLRDDLGDGEIAGFAVGFLTFEGQRDLGIPAINHLGREIALFVVANFYQCFRMVREGQITEKTVGAIVIDKRGQTIGVIVLARDGGGSGAVGRSNFMAARRRKSRQRDGN